MLSNPLSTTLSGDIGTLGNNADNSYHVFNNPTGLTNSAVLDGFLITGGNANSSTLPDNGGGGMLNNGNGASNNCSPLIRNCLFQNNTAASGGGALYNAGYTNGNSNPSLINCAFQSNSAGSQGGAIYNDGSIGGNSNASLTNCSFQGNSAPSGGVMYNIGYQGSSHPNLTNCVVWGNGGSSTFSNGPNAFITTSYSLFESSVTGYNGGTGNLATATSPFASATATLLRCGSVAIDAGDPATTSATVGSIDLAGNNRFYAGGRIDMGAYETQAAPSIAIPSVSTATVGVSFSQSFTASGGTSPYSYSLASGSLPTGLGLANTGVVSGTPTQLGSFTLTVMGRDAVGCSGVSTAYVLTVVNANPTLTGLAVSPGAVCVGRVATFTATVGNLTGSYNYTLTNGLSTSLTGSASGSPFSQSVTASGTGTQSFTLTVSANGQSASSAKTLTVNPLPVASLTNNGPLSCAQSSVTLTAGGGSSYTFASGSGVVGTPGPITTVVVSSSGIYSVTVANASGCVSTTSTVVTADQAIPSISISPSSATLTCANPVVSLSAISSGSVRWSTGQNTPVISVSVAGPYSVTAMGSNGCSSVASVSISQDNTVPMVSLVSSGTISCAVTSVTLTASPNGLSYAFSGPGVVSQNGNKAVVNLAGTYSVTMSNGNNGCSAIASTSVSQDNTQPTARLTNNGPLSCTMTTVTLTASGGTSYRFSSGANQISSGPTATVSSAGLYSVTVVGSNGCSAVASVSVSQDNTAPVASLVSSGTISCAVTSVTLTANPNGLSYAFSGPGVVSQSGNQAVVNTAGIYSVTVTNGGNGCSSVASVSVVQNNTIPVATLSASPSTTLTCARTSLTLTAGEGNAYAYTFSGPGIVSQTGNRAVVNAAGVYSVTVSISNTGCFSVTTITVDQDITVPQASLTASPSATLTCAQTSLTLTAGGGDIYTFTGPGIVNQSGNTARVNTAGVYSVTVTSAARGCSSTTAITIDQTTNSPEASLESSGVLTCAVSSVTLTASPEGLRYQFSNGASPIGSTNQAIVSEPGLYSVTVISANGCSATATTTVARDNAAPVASLISSGTLSCGVTSVTLTASPSAQIYRFSAGAAQIGTSNQAVVSASGPYSVTLIYSNACSAIASTSVSEDNTAPMAGLTNNGPLSCTMTSVTLTASGGSTYRFSSGANQMGNGPTATVSSAGVYSVTVISGNGCSAVASVSVSQDNTAPLVSITANPSLTIAQGQSATLTASGANTYAWNTGANTASITASTAGPYSVTGTASNGCSATATVTLSVTSPPVASGPFAITGVTTLDCTPVLPNRFSLSFTPRYSGLDGSPVSFSVTNELIPTTQPGPYTLQLYTDNPVIALSAVQSGVASSFAYNWLEACRTTTAPNTPPRVVSAIPSQTATVGQFMSYVIPNGTFTDDETPLSLQLSARGVPAGLSFSGATLSGTPSSTVGSPYSITITATDPGNLAASTDLVLTVLPAGGTPPDPTAPFAITGVTTLSCTPVANRISLTFAPRYAGVNGQPIAFEVINELSPTTDPAPYSLTLYRDNPVITLRAVQTGSGGPVTFRYHWLDACAGLGQENTPPKLNEPVAPQSATVGSGYSLNLSNTFTDQETPTQVSLSAAGLPAGLSVSGQFISGTPSVSGVSSVTLTATDGGGLSTSTSFSFTVYPGQGTPPPNPPSGVFSITGVATLSCQVLSAGQRRVSFNPQYAGLDGSPVSFSVVNELLPTTNSGPYTLNLYTDNSTITLKAIQSGVSTSFAYNWLAACQTSTPRVGARGEMPLRVTVLGNPVLGERVTVEIQGAEGQRLALELSDERGHRVSEKSIGRAEEVERQTLSLGQVPAGVLLLRVSTSTQSQTLKLLKTE